MARFATYSIKYRREPGCYDWQDRQQHLADLFAPESRMSFGEGKPSDEQKAKGQTHARKFNHRVHHLKCNHNIIVLQLANSIDVAMENQFETVNRRDEPSEFVIIDNRKGIRTVAIQNRKKAFSAPRKVADILQQEISTRLYKDHCYTIEIMPEYYPEDLYKLWEMRQRDIQLLRFSSPQKMEEKEVIQKAEEMQKLWPERYNATFMSQLLSIALMARKANYDMKFDISPLDKKCMLFVDQNSTYMQNLVTMARASGEPVEIVTKDGSTFRCFVDTEDENTDKIVHHELDQSLLEMFFKDKRKDGEKAGPEDIDKAEAKVVEMLNAIKKTEEDTKEQEDVA